ncbi:MAG: DUF6440 family protein [Faecousia sp.]
MANESDRFVRVYKQGGALSTQVHIWVDKVTGVNYLVMPGSYGAAITPLLNRDGTPVVSPLPLREA